METMNWAPLVLISAATAAWFALTAPVLTPLLVVSPQSSMTSKVRGPLPLAVCNVLNCGDAADPSRSTGVAPPVVIR